MRHISLIRVFVLLTVVAAGAVLLAGRPGDVRALFNFSAPWDHWDDDNCGAPCPPGLGSIPLTASSSSDTSLPGQAQASAGSPSYFAGIGSAWAWAEQGETFIPSSSGLHRVAFQYSYDGTAGGSATLGGGIAGTAISSANAGVSVAVVDSTGAVVASAGESIYAGSVASETPGDTVSYDDALQGTFDTHFYVNLNAGEEYLFKGRLDVGASASSGFMPPNPNPVPGQAIAQIDANGSLVSLTIMPQPDLEMEYSPHTTEPSATTTVDVTFRNVGVTTLELPFYLAFGTFLGSGPDLLPGQETTFHPVVNTLSYTCGTLNSTAQAWGRWGPEGKTYVGQFPIAIDVLVDGDGDGVCDPVDNCPSDPNPGQENADAAIGNGTGIAGDDTTVPNGDPTDTEGDACETDGDADNDGIPDGSDPDPGGDITYDDNGNGDPCVPLGSDAADDGPSWDSNCNAVLDGQEGNCPLAVNPNGDDDGDGLLNTWEVCKWGTDPTVVDSDGGGLGDCTEAVDTNGNGIVLGDFGIDAINSARATLLPAGTGPDQFGKDGDFDLNGNTLILGDFGIDTLETVRFTLGLKTCQ